MALGDQVADIEIGYPEADKCAGRCHSGNDRQGQVGFHHEGDIGEGNARHHHGGNQALRVLAKESRDFRMAAAEKKAASLPPKLTVPMILFFLPVLFAVIAAPAVLQAIGAS